MAKLAKAWRVEVEWDDSTLLRDGWQQVSAILKRRKAPRCLSVGVVLADDAKGIVLAASIHGSEAAGVTMIPRRAIVKSRRLR